MIEKKWNILSANCPINIERIVDYGREFESNVPSKITLENLNKSKEKLLMARANLDSMIINLIQNLYSTEILKKQEDKILFSWLLDNFGRFLKRLDEEEFNLVVKLDSPSYNEVGISRLSAYVKMLVTSVDNVIYESLLKSTEEYNCLIDGEKGIVKEPRVFLYILFQVLQITLSILGGLSREKTSGKKGMINSIPTSWQSLMSSSGEKIIKEGYKEETGIDVSKFGDGIEILNFDDIDFKNDKKNN